ncbi:MAG: macro domain-containing protein [Candidatus Limnocylindria bacterium]
MAVPTEIDVWQGDVSELEVDAIIVPANESLFMTTPVARAVKRRAGQVVEVEAVGQAPAQAGSAVVTGGGLLATPYIIHAVAVGHDLRPDRERLARALDAALEIAGRLGLGRLAMAPVGLEHGVFTPDDAAGVLMAVLAERVTRGATLPAQLVVAVTGRGEAAAFRVAAESPGAPSR